MSDFYCHVCHGTAGYWADTWRPCSACDGTGHEASRQEKRSRGRAGA